MKKKIYVNTKILKESSIKVGDKNYEQRLRRRITDLRRVSQMAKEAAEKAEQAGNTELAKKLNDRVEEIEKLLATYNIDIIEPEEVEAEDTAKDDLEKDSEKEDNEESHEEEEDTSDIDTEEEASEPFEFPDDTTDNTEIKDYPGDDNEDTEEESSDEENDIDTEEEDTNESDSEESESETEDTDDTTDNSEDGDSENSEEEEESDDEEDELDEHETDDSPIKDPFADEEDIPDLNLGGGNQEPRDATLKDITDQLKGLSSDAKKGAIAALQNIINSRKPKTESLTEAVKGVREMTDDEFGDYINSTYDLIDQVEALDYEDAEELKKKKARVGQWSTDPKTLKELEAEDDVALEKDFRKEKAREKENTKYAKIGTLDEFKLNFYNAIKHQVEMVIQEYQSYNEINAEYESEDVIMKADLTQEIPEEVIPIIDIYFDVSGSWGPEDIEIGKKAIATVKEFEDAGEIKLNIFYFSGGVSNTFESTRALYGTGTRG